MPEAREIIVCPACELRQFMTQSGNCRRCHSVLNPPPPPIENIKPEVIEAGSELGRNLSHTLAQAKRGLSEDRSRIQGGRPLKLGAKDYYPATLDLNSQPLPHKSLEELCPDDAPLKPWRDHAVFCRASSFVFRLLRFSRGLSQSQVAAKLGCPRTYISKMDNGKVLPKTEHLSQIAAAFGCSSFFLASAILTVHEIQAGKIALEVDDVMEAVRTEAFRAHNMKRVATGA